MPRLARIVIPGAPHHVVQRGNNRQEIFVTDHDRETFLLLLGEQAAQWGMTIEGYSLLPDHVHLIATPRDAGALPMALGRAHYAFTHYMNAAHGRRGHLWQNRFSSCALDSSSFWLALRVMEREPVEQKLAENPWDYPWSSASAHLGGADESHLLDLRAWRKLVEWSAWRDQLQTPPDPDKVEELARHTSSGRPLGDDLFLDGLEKSLGYAVRPLPVGRPRKDNPPGLPRAAKG